MNKVIRTIAFLSFISFAAFLFGCDSSAATRNEKNQIENVPMPQISSGKPKIVAFGDSLTAGFGVAEKESYPYLLQEKLKADGYNYEVVNAGVSGDTSAGGLERVDWSLDQDNVKIVILELGANDMLRGLSVPQMRKNLDAIIKKAKSKNIQVLLCGLFPPDAPVSKDQSAFAKTFQELAKENNVEFMPFFLENVGGVKNLNQADGIHPNAEGTRVVTENVYKSLQPLLKK
jgi:acyl-CoA thioesterase-1